MGKYVSHPISIGNYDISTRAEGQRVGICETGFDVYYCHCYNIFDFSEQVFIFKLEKILYPDHFFSNYELSCKSGQVVISRYL